MFRKWTIRYSLIILFLFVLSILVFPRFYGKQFILWRLKAFSGSVLGARFSFEDSFWEEKVLVIRSAKIVKEESNCTIDEARLTPFFSLKKRVLGGNLSIEGMTLIVGKKEEEDLFPQTLFDRMSCLNLPLFTTKLHTRVGRGALFLYNFTNKEPIFHRLDWEGEHFLQGAKSHGRIAVDFDPQSPLLHVEFSQSEEGHLHLHSSLSTHPITPLIGAGRMLLRSHFSTPAYDWLCKEGFVEGCVDADFLKGEMTALSGRLHIQDLVSENPSLKIKMEIFDLFSTLDLDFVSPDCVESWDGHFKIEGGTLTGMDFDHILFEEIWKLSDLSSKIVVRGGEVESSLLSGTLMGMRGEMELNWDSPDELATLSFCGDSKEIASFVPEGKRKEFLIAFPSDTFSLGALVTRDLKGLKLEGDLEIASQEGESQRFDFGCQLGDDLSLMKKNKVEEGSYVAQSVETMIGRLKRQFCLAQKKGWFTANQVDLNKYIAPFLLGDLLLDLEGRVNINAHFDNHYLVLFYEGENISLESPHYRLKTKQLEATSGNKPAVSYINLQTFEHLGFLPLNDFSYDQENFDLHFEEAKAMICFDGGTITMKDIETNWGELALFGEVSVTMRSREDVDLSIAIDKSVGPALDARDFLSHFSASSFWKLPISGHVDSKKGEIFFAYHFSPEAKLTEGRMHGHVVMEGSTDHLLKLNVPLGTLMFDTEFDFDPLSKELIFNDGFGRVVSDKFGSYEIISNALSFHDLPNLISTCDISFLQDGKGCGRLALASKSSEGNHEIILDETKTHFGKIVPHLQTSITHNDDDISFEISAGDLFQISGGLEGNHLFINHFICGKLEGMGDCLLSKEGCEIPYIGFQMDDLGYIALQGNFEKQSGSLNCYISDFSLDLSTLTQLSFWPEGLQSQFEKWGVSGRVEGAGKFSCQTGESFVLEAETFSTFEGIEVAGIEFGDGENLKCTFSSTRGFSVEGLKIAVGEEDSLLSPMRCRLGKFNFDLKDGRLLFEGLDFWLPKERLPWMGGILMQLFPEVLPTTFPTYLENLKNEEPLAGRVSFEVSEDSQWIYLTLGDGIYTVGDREVPLKEFSCYFDGKGISVQTGTTLLDLPLELKLMMSDLEVPKGVITLFHEEEALAIDFHKSRLGMFDVDKVTGSLLGVQVDLLQDRVWIDPLRIRLVGDVVIDGNELMPHLNHTINLGKGYTLSGHFTILRQCPQDFHFSGTLLGRDFEVGDITLGSMNADLNFTPTHCELKNIDVKDRGGGLFCEEATLSKQGDEWYFHIPNTRLTRFKLARLRSLKLGQIKKRKRSFNSLLVQTGELHHFMGKLNDQSTYRGTGFLLFSNYARKGLVDNILQIPADIIARIGLDLTLLVPVRGKVNYEIGDNRVYLTKCEEVYSDRKRSRFFLAKGPLSYVDFKGNLNINVKMKQYNLLMKFVELLTMNVRGTLFKPSYHLFTHKDNLHASP